MEKKTPNSTDKLPSNLEQLQDLKLNVFKNPHTISEIVQGIRADREAWEAKNRATALKKAKRKLNVEDFENDTF